MQNIQKISTDLFNKLRGRFDQITIGDESGTVTNTPDNARFFDFAYTEGKKELGKVSVSINEEDKLTVIFSKDFITAEDSFTQKNWYNFLKELRQFAKKRMLEFDVRDINKSNLTKRDYKFLAKQSGDENMNESKMYGTSRVSYQNVDEARIVIKHTENINQELNNRTQKIGSIYIESNDGERFKYPYKHLNGARAMARHVAEGGKPYDDFGKHITSLSEELSKLKKFTSYMGRSAVMAESLAEYTDVVKGRIKTVKKTIESLQKKKNYTEAFSSFESPVLEDVPSDVAENWIDQLTVRQFNEELKDVFPYIYKLVSEATKATELGPDDLVKEAKEEATCGCGPDCGHCGGKHTMKEVGTKCSCCDNEVKAVTAEGKSPHKKGKYSKAEKTKEEIEIETAFEKMMGQFAEAPAPEEFKGEIEDFEVTGDDGEPEGADIHYTAKIVNGKPVVDPKSIEVHAYGNNPSSKLGYDVDGDTDMIMNYGGVDAEEILRSAQEDAEETWAERDNKYAHGESVCSECGNPSYTTLPEEKQKGVDGKVCWKGYKRMGTKKKGGKTVDNCVKIKDDVEMDEKEQKTPLGEFILSYFDREQGAFPKGETAVLTMVEKDYGERFIEPAKAFIEQIQATYEEIQMRTQPQQMEVDTGFDRMRELAGLR